MSDNADWCTGGFPDTRATTKQRQYLQRRLHLLIRLLPLEDSTALHLMGFDRWLVSVSKDRASVFIGKVKLEEESLKNEGIAKSIVVEDRVKEIAYKEGICFVCGGLLIKGRVSARCGECGKTTFHVSLS